MITRIEDIPKIDAGNLPQFFTTTTKFRLGGDIDIFCASSRQFKRSLEMILRGLDVPRVFLLSKRVGVGHIQTDIRNVETRQVLIRFDIHDFRYFRNLGFARELGPTLFNSGSNSDNPTLLGGNVLLQRQHISLLKLAIYCQNFWLGTDKLNYIEWLVQHLNPDEIDDLIMVSSKFVIKRPRFSRKGRLLEIAAATAIFFTSSSVFIRLQQLKWAATRKFRSIRRG